MYILLFTAIIALLVFLFFSALPILLPVMLVFFFASLIFRPRVHVVTRTYSFGNPGNTQADEPVFKTTPSLPSAQDVVDADYSETYTD